ncbi:glycosyltransferase [Pseudomonas umsongensis]|nr:glycosyltransferase [Pseudomonas umsongensis]
MLKERSPASLVQKPKGDRVAFSDGEYPFSVRSIDLVIEKAKMGKKIVLLGFYVGDSYFDRYSKDDAFPQIAAYKLEKRFLDALRFGGACVQTIASIAVSTYPRNKNWFFPGGSFSDVSGTGVVTPIVNLPIFKVFTRLLGSLAGLIKHKNGLDAVCVYAAHTPNLLAAFMMQKLCGVPFFVFIPDLPSYMDMGMKRSKVLRGLKKIDAYIIDRLIAASSGVFVTSQHMVKDSLVWSDKNYLVVEGISNASAVSVESVDNSLERKKVIFYAGGLNKAYGIVELIEGFIESEVDAELWLCGRGELEGYISETSRMHPSVKYLGFLTASEVEHIQSSASCLVLSRSPEHAYTRYSFPSKLLEYLASGVPILTTRLEGIPDEYYEFLNVIEDSTAGGVSTALKRFFAADQQFLLEKAACGRIWVSETKSSFAVGQKIVDFMEKSN